jgi:hypothetical protein
MCALLPRCVYCSYGECAWWWEAEELVRKLLLTAAAVLLDAGSPLQARACSNSAVGVCVCSIGPRQPRLLGAHARMHMLSHC